MIASQLLSILQTIPTDVNYETCAFNAPKPKFTMTENQIGIMCNSNRYEREADRLSFSASDPLHANCGGGNPNSSAFGIEDGRDFWSTAVSKSSVLDNSTRSNGTEPGGSPTVGDQIPCHLYGFEKDAESLVSGVKDENETQITQEAVRSVIDCQLPKPNGKESKDSETSTTVLQALESDLNPFTDKNVLECELPEFVVCYKESDTQIVKDICVDEGVPFEKKSLTESDKDDHSGSFVLQPSDVGRYFGTTKDPDVESFVPGGLNVSSLENNSHDSASELRTEKIDEAGAAEDGLEERSCVSSSYVSEDFIIGEALLESFKCDEGEVADQPDKIPSIEAILESLAVAFTSEDSRKDGPVSNLCYNSKVEGGTITFDFNSSKSACTSSMEGSGEDQGAELTAEKAPEAENEDLNDHLASFPAQLANSEEKIKENASDTKPLRRGAHNDENGHSGNLSMSGRLQRGEGESSFSTSGPVSGLITYSGPIVYSGSVSLRSDSSTTSTRSFAFPILQAEWNSSPVRMQKARKHRGWRHGLFCCRF